MPPGRPFSEKKVPEHAFACPGTSLSFYSLKSIRLFVKIINSNDPVFKNNYFYVPSMNEISLHSC